MQIRIVAVGQKLPKWADTAVDDYLKRFPPAWKLSVHPVRAETRAGTYGTDAAAGYMDREATRIRAQIPDGAHLVVLDERGADLSTMKLASRLEAWALDARPVAIVIGGPDGIAGSLKNEARESIRLSSMTLPHALVRVLLAEQLYRAWSVLEGHPYHRE